MCNIGETAYHDTKIPHEEEHEVVCYKNCNGYSFISIHSESLGPTKQKMTNIIVIVSVVA